MSFRETVCSDRGRMRGGIRGPADARLYTPQGASSPGMAPICSTRNLDPGPDPPDRELDPLREEIRLQKGGERPGGVPHETAPFRTQGPDEDELSPLEGGDRKASGALPDVGKGLAHFPPARIILRAACSRSRISRLVRSARATSARHSRM